MSRGSRNRARRPHLTTWVGIALAVVCVRTAFASTIESVHIDHVAVTEGGKHRVWISALDAEGNPVQGIEGHAVRVSEDGEGMSEVLVQPFDVSYASVDVTVIVDPVIASETLGENNSAWTGRLLAMLRPGDRLRLVGAGEGLPTVTVRSESELTSSRDRLRALAVSSPPRVFDALLQEVKRARRSTRGDVILVVTQGADRRSRHEAVEVLALLRSFTRPAPISVFLRDGAEEPGDVSRLNRLTQESGGITRRVQSAEGLAGALPEAVRRARGAYLLSYRPKRWDRDADRHQLRVAVRQAGTQRATETEFATNDVVVTPRAWSVWAAGVAVILLLGFGVAYTFRPRSIARLVIENGAERGCWFEIFEAPITIGAAIGNHILLPEPHVSRNHAMLERRGRFLEVIDQNSENGTFVNRDRVSRRLLSPGDTITFGGTISLTYHGPGTIRKRA
jgi:hypothetical protein